MIIEKMDFFLHDMFMEIMSNMESLQDYEETIDALEEGCRLHISADGETEEERAERLKRAEERKKQLEKEKEAAQKEKEREAIERRIRLLDTIREFMALNDISTIPGIAPGLETLMFVPLKALTIAIRKCHPGEDDKDIEFDRDDRMLVKTELRRVRTRLEDMDGVAISKQNVKEPVRKEKQEVLTSPVLTRTLQ